MLRTFILLAIVSVIGWTLYRNYIRRTTVLLDLPQVGAPLDKPKLKGTAVVVGGSISGLLAARVLSDHFESVFVIDDELPFEVSDAAYTRPNVSQWNFLHVTSALAVRICTLLFPDFVNEIKARDGRFFPLHHFSMWQYGRPLKFAPDPSMSSCAISRGGFEHSVRSLLRSIPNVRVLKAKVVEVTEKQGRFTKVSYRLDDRPELETVEAALVADCSGTARCGIKWAKRNGLQIPSVSTYDTKAIATSFEWHLSEEQWQSLLFPLPHDQVAFPLMWAAEPNDPRGTFYCCRLEHNQLCIGLTSINGSPTPPQTTEELFDLIQDRPLPAWFLEDLLPALRKLVPDKIRRLAIPSYSNVAWSDVHVCSNFVALADAVCRLNPIYGQGMTQAAIHCVTLDAELRKARKKGLKVVDVGFGDRVMQLNSSRSHGMLHGNKLFDYEWTGSIPAEDEKLHMDNGGTPLELKVMEAMIKAASEDGVVGHALLKVISSMAPSTLLLTILPRVAWHTLKVRVKQLVKQ